MWPFKKNHPALSDLPRDGTWNISQGTLDGHPILVRVNTAVDRFRGHPELKHQVGLAVPFKSPDADGMPGSTEVDDLNEIEDRLFEIFEAEAQSIVVAVVTTNGMREFVLYTRDPIGVRDRYNEFKPRIHSGHDIQLMIQPDSDWSVFAQFR